MVQVPDRVHKLKCTAERGWIAEHSRIGDDTEETAEDEFRDRKGIVTVHN